MIQARLKTVERKTTVSRAEVKAAWAKVLGIHEDTKTVRPSPKPTKKTVVNKQG